MPEAPEMQVAAEFLGARLPGARVEEARILKPVVRSALYDMEQDAVGREFEGVERRGKFFIVGRAARGRQPEARRRLSALPD